MPLATPVAPSARSESDQQPLIVNRPLFRSTLLRIDGVVARATGAGPTAERELDRHGVVLPYQGVFATHASRRDTVVASASHALLLSARMPYRYSYPGAIGDRCLVLLWSDEALARTVPEAIRDARFDASRLATAPVLPPATLLARESLRALLAEPDPDPLAVETGAIGLLTDVLRAARRDSADRAASSTRTVARDRARVERVKELVGIDATRRWTLDALAAAAAVSPYHLAHLFKARTGVSVYDYVLRARLAGALQQVVDSELDLSTIALDAGYASHSHFTAQFRARFGTTPLALRAATRRRGIAQLHRIATAERRTAR